VQIVKNRKNQTLKHLVLFFIAILSLSQAANLIRAAAAPPLMIGFWRLFGAASLMLILRAWNSRQNWSGFFEVPTRASWLWTFLSGSFFFMHLWTFFFSAQNTTIANCMVIFSTNPLFTALGASVLLKDKFEKRYALAFFLAFVGVAALVSDRLSWDQGRTGDLAALVSAFFFSLYILTGKKARLQISTDQFAWMIYGWAALLFLAVGMSQNVQWIGYPDLTWWAIAGNIVLPTLLGHVLFTHLLKYLNINWMSCGKLLEPAFSSIVAFLVFHESLKNETYVSFVFTALSVLVLFWPLLFNRAKNAEKAL
jgi:drug/metabolite transporter (DMT)-like permease